MRIPPWSATFAASVCLVACARPANPTASAVTLTATDYRFAGPDTVASGLAVVQMINRGKELHHTVLIKIGDGHTLGDFESAMAAVVAKKAPPPRWISYAGGPNAINPGDSTSATEILEPGQYVAVCVIPTADGTPHVAKGMIHPLVVKGPAPAATVALPDADITLKLTDYDFTLSAPLAAGSHTVRVQNAGAQAHELVVAEAAPGVTPADFVAWEKGGEKGVPPATRWLGGVTGIEAGQSANFTVTLKPGTYLLVCFWPDAKDGKPHFMHGMIKQVTVS